MMNNNKILTVSYGTFSCTLEGFDDSFDTMKAIAEYFRDLAADDRYFGAEPPQPDAELLARIAEREVARRVEAQEHDGRILLKAHDAEAENAPHAEDAPVAKTAAPVIPAVQTETDPATQDISPRTEAPVEAAAPAPTETPAAAPSDIAYDDRPASADDSENEEPAMSDQAEDDVDTQISAAVAESVLDQTASDETTETDVPLEELEEPVAVARADEAGLEEAEVAVADEEPLEVVADAENLEDETVTATAPVEPAQDDAPLSDFEATEAADSEVASEEDEDSAEAFFAQSVAADVAVYEDEAPVTDLTDAVSLADAIKVTDAEDHVAETSEDETFADKLARIRAVVSTNDDVTDNAEYEEDLESTPSIGSAADFEEAFAVADTEAVDHLSVDVVTQAAQDIAEAFEQDEAAFEPLETEDDQSAEREPDDLDEILKKIEIESEEDASNENLFGDAETADDAQEVTGRVLKVNRTDLEAALASGDLEDLDEDEAPEDAPTAFDDYEAAPRQTLPQIDEEASEDVSRLMAEADQQMQEPEGKTRRSAFAHLRAAVAARFADRSMDTSEDQDAVETEAYRNDLAEVVRPRRPETSENRTERPADEAAAPLKLVAEQRIDHDGTTSSGPIAPRRVSAPMDEPEFEPDTAKESEFAVYAAERGASTLPELLEAAAAYLSYVEGHEQFSRPELMSRVRQADCGEFTREDGLRSFGQLLRTGKIEKIKGGRFTASEGIGYKPGHRAAG